MSNVLNVERAKEFAEVSRWLHSNYNDLIITYNGRYVAIRNRIVIDDDADLDKLKEKLSQRGIESATVLVEFIKDKSNELD